MQTNNVIEEVKDLAAEKKQAIASVKKSVTRATKARRQKELLRKLLQERSYKWNELLDEAVKSYLKKYEGEETDVPDLKGKFGSNFALLEEAGEVAFDKATNTCTLVAAQPKSDDGSKNDRKAKGAPKKSGQQPDSTPEAKTEQTQKSAEKADETAANDKPTAKESPEKVKRAASRKKNVKESQEAKAEKAPLADNATAKDKQSETLAPQTVAENAEKKAEDKADKTSAKKADGSSAAPKSVAVEKTAPVKEAQKSPLAKSANAKKETSLMDFVFLGNATKKSEKQLKAAEPKNSAEQLKTAEQRKEAVELPKQTEQPKAAEEQLLVHSDDKGDIAEKSVVSTAPVVPTVPVTPTAPVPTVPVALEKNDAEAKGKKEPNRAVRTQQSGRENAVPSRGRGEVKRLPVPSSPRQNQTQEQLKEEFLKRLRLLSGEYFEYYSVYLLERYSLKSGRRLEGFRVSGGKNDGGIDGEIELTDRFGFRETIYIQAKNWDPTKGIAEKWTVGETLLQQFVGAVTCRQAKDGKRNSRGIFMTTSHFTKEARELLTLLGEKFIGYDGDDVFETAKECEFGLIKENGVYKIDEKLLSSDKAFFHM